MATLKLYLDKRSVDKQGLSPIKIAINHKSSTALIGTNIRVKENQWDNDTLKVISHPSKQNYNSFLQSRLFQLEDRVLEISKTKNLSDMSASDLKQILIDMDNPNFGQVKFKDVATNFIATKHLKGTKISYTQAMSSLSKFCDIDNLLIEQMNNNFMRGYIDNCRKNKNSENTINSYLTRIKSILLFAYDEDIIEKLPYKKIAVKKLPTRKRSFTLDELRYIFNYKAKNKSQEMTIDAFKLTFYLIGINYVDLVSPNNIINNGRLEYIRRKTHKLYSIKIYQEALDIIEKYKVDGFVFPPFNNDYNQYRYGIEHFNYNLKIICNNPDVSFYWARHTWATLCSEIDIPKEVIAAGLGHSSNSVTDIYIKFDMQKVDIANRKVIDYVLGKNN